MASTQKAILVGTDVVLEPDLTRWALWFESSDRTVKRTQMPSGDIVSTVFLGIDHSMFGPTPLWFETMIFSSDENNYELYQTRCSTYEEALKMHDLAVEIAMRG